MCPETLSVILTVKFSGCADVESSCSDADSSVASNREGIEAFCSELGCLFGREEIDGFQKLPGVCQPIGFLPIANESKVEQSQGTVSINDQIGRLDVAGRKFHGELFAQSLVTGQKDLPHSDVSDAFTKFVVTQP